MNRKYKVKIVKYRKNLFHVVISLNKKSIRSRYIMKIGVCYFLNNNKIIILSLKKLSYWLNKGVCLTNYVSYMSSILFSTYLRKNQKKIEFMHKNVNYLLKKKS